MVFSWTHAMRTVERYPQWYKTGVTGNFGERMDWSLCMYTVLTLCTLPRFKSQNWWQLVHTFLLVQGSKVKQLAVFPAGNKFRAVVCCHKMNCCSLYELTIGRNKKQIELNFDSCWADGVFRLLKNNGWSFGSRADFSSPIAKMKSFKHDSEEKTTWKSGDCS